MSSRQANGDRHVTFDFHAKNCFLTYPQCNVSLAVALEHLLSITGDKASYITVAHEKHADGGDHLHALICFKVSKVSNYEKKQRQVNL